MAQMALGSSEGLYNSDQGKNLEYKDRISEQQELKAFTAKVFSHKREFSFADYKEFISNVSSEMYFSLMSLLHEQLPCSMNFFRLKKLYRAKLAQGFLGSNRKS